MDNTQKRYAIIATVFIFVALLLFIFASKVLGQEGCDPAHKLWICHTPPGNPENVQTICIDQHAWEDPHEKHGDSQGQCPNPTITCGAPFQVVPGTLESNVVATGWQMTGPFVVEKVGPVTMDEFTCAPAAEKKWACTYQGSGDTQYEGDQRLTVRFSNDYGLTVECLMEGGVGGLPVELQEFQVD